MSALLPVSLDLARLSVVLIGNGTRAERRLRLLDETGAGRLSVFSADPVTELSARAGDRLRRRLPTATDLNRASIVFIADLNADEARAIADLAREAGALVNVEDVTGACDFHSAAVVRRGDLAIGITTGGRCPMLARVLKQWLERVLPANFAHIVAALSGQRSRLKQDGAGHAPLEATAIRAVVGLDALLYSRSLHTNQT